MIRMSSQSSSASLRICVVSTIVRPRRPLAPQQIHDRSLEQRIHAGRELVEEHHGRLDHQRLRDLHAPPESAGQIHDLPSGLLRESELLHHRPRHASARRVRAAVKPRERQQVVPHGEKELRRVLLDDRRNAAAHVERARHDVVAEDGGRATGRRRDRVVRIFNVVLLPAPFGPSRPKIDPGATSKLRPSTARTGCWPRRVYVFTRFVTEIAEVLMSAPVESGPSVRRQTRMPRALRPGATAKRTGMEAGACEKGLPVPFYGERRTDTEVVFRSSGERSARNFHSALEEITLSQ